LTAKPVFTVRRVDNGFEISDGKDILLLTPAQYEDVYYAIPLDNPGLFLLLNDTILDKVEDRKALQRMTERAGGINSAMSALQEAVKKVSPKEEPAPAKPEKAPVEEKPIATAPSRSTEVADAPPAPKKPPLKAPPKEEPAEAETTLAGPEKEEAVKEIRLIKLSNGSYAITFGKHRVELTPAKFKQLCNALPISVPALFQLFFTHLLKGPEVKSEFRAMMRAAGGSTTFLQQLIKKLQKLTKRSS
jgi:hypothetical protein